MGIPLPFRKSEEIKNLETIAALAIGVGNSTENGYEVEYTNSEYSIKITVY